MRLLNSNIPVNHGWQVTDGYIHQQVDRLLHLIMEEKQAAETSGHSLPLTIVFVERKARCDEVADALCQEGILATALHGGRSQVCHVAHG